MNSVQFSFNVWLYLFILTNINAIRIQFYKNENFTGLTYETRSTMKCNNFPVKSKYNVRSVQTDTCVLIYMDPNCISTWSIKILHNNSYPPFWALGSFHICNDDDGGPQLNIDITEYFEKSTQTPKLMESYKDVCHCIRIPDYIQEMDKWSINNHGNNFLAYFDPNCLDTSNARFIRAGHSLESDMHRHLFKNGENVHRIKSIGPIINSTYYNASCYPYSKIMRLELLENSRATELYAVRNNEPNNCKTELESIELMTGKVNFIFFFAEENFRDFLFKSEADKQCRNLPLPNSHRWVTDVIGSVITEVCVLIFSDYDCLGRSVKLQPGKFVNLTRQWESTVTGPNTLSRIYAKLENWTWATKSFHACNYEEGGPYLNVDITEYHLNISTYPTVLETYRNVQSCQNIPKYIRSMEKWSINNHGNPMITYFEPDCSTNNFEPLWVPAGVSSFSIGLSSFKKVDEITGSIHKIQSFSNVPSGEYIEETCNTADYLMPRRKLN